MSKKYRRNHNLKSISSNRSYTIGEVAERIGVQNKTVYGWIKGGLHIIECSSPARIHGSDIIEYHKSKRKAQKQSCKDNEMFCCSCQKPQRVLNNQIVVENRTSKIINFKGKCEVCNCGMNRTISPLRIEYFKKSFSGVKGLQLTLEGF